MIINLISGPRNISTALMYSFAQRSDTQVWDEPFYALYLQASGAIHPGREEVLETQSSDERVVKKLVEETSNAPVVFIKNMAHHMEVMKEPFFKNSINLFLIRNPQQIISSYAQVIERPVMRDIGIEYQWTLFNELAKNNQRTIVVDSGLLLENPESVLQLLCASCAIPFQRSMLSWPPGPKTYDGTWAKHWYSNVHRSTSFQKQESSSRTLPDDLNALYQEAKHYYEKLLPFSLKA